MSYPYPSLGLFTIYSIPDCIYCEKVKQLLENNHKKYVIVSCESFLMNHRDEFLATMDQLAGKVQRTFPFVFSDKVFVGGYQDTVALLEKEKKESISFHDDF